MMDTPCAFTMLSIDLLEYDYQNPRIAQYLEIYDKQDLTPEQIYLALGKGQHETDPSAPSFHTLEESIRTHGRIIHPILVNHEPGGRRVVIEGNTRLAIYRRFRDEQYQGDWTTIPAMVYEALDDASIDAIRLQTHLVGARPWQPYAKAKYLDFLRNSQHLTMNQIIAFSGGPQREVQDYIGAYRDMEKYYRPVLDSDADFDPTRFSAFVEVQRANVQRAIYDAKFDLQDFARWVHTRKIYPLSTVRDLPRILANEKAKLAFIERGAGEAIRLLDVPDTDTHLDAIGLEVLLREVTRRIRQMPYSEVKALRTDSSGPGVRALLDARDELTDLANL